MIDGGPLGFLTWSIPTLVGSFAYDAVLHSTDRGKTLAKLAGLVRCAYALWATPLSCGGGHLAAPAVCGSPATRDRRSLDDEPAHRECVLPHVRRRVSRWRSMLCFSSFAIAGAGRPLSSASSARMPWSRMWSTRWSQAPSSPTCRTTARSGTWRRGSVVYFAICVAFNAVPRTTQAVRPALERRIRLAARSPWASPA